MNMFKMNGEIMGKIREYDNLSKDELISMLINNEITYNDMENQYKSQISKLNENIVELKEDVAEWKEFHNMTIKAKNNDIDLLIDNNNYWIKELDDKKAEIKRLNEVIYDLECQYGVFDEALEEIAEEIMSDDEEFDEYLEYIEELWEKNYGDDVE